MLLSPLPYYTAVNGKVSFQSKATSEIIEAVSTELKGVLQQETNAFSFVIDMDSFNGFNNELQKDHYRENYVETDKYPNATFNGKIIEVIHYNNPGIFQVRAKGKFSLHGYSYIKIIPATLQIVNSKTIRILSEFNLSLQEFDIKVPRLVHKKVAQSIKIDIDVTMHKS
jgi:polyisoprenoid-binding protein YceI